VSRRASVRAPAKVNLVLRVSGRRADGYHDIDTLFLAIDLCDQVDVELKGTGVAIEVGGADVGPDEENLAFRAAERFVDEAGFDQGVGIRLDKAIPTGAGLGGGSSDAAAVLRCLEALVGGVGDGRLGEIGAELGSDVPFFLGVSSLARGTGRGEVLEPCEPLPPADLVVVSPPVHVSTAAAYAALGEVRAEAFDGVGARVGGDGAWREPSLPSQIRDWEQAEALMENDFEPVIVASHPEVRRALGALRATGARSALMSGSGSSCFGVFGSRAEAVAAARRIGEELGWPCRPVRSLASLPEVQVG
jgi:4-diphosphocytidyl-2-C-methyl-D-erythritol kinase